MANNNTLGACNAPGFSAAPGMRTAVDTRTALGAPGARNAPGALGAPGVSTVPDVSTALGARPAPGHTIHPGLRDILGDPAWHRLPAAVRARFAEPVLAVDYVGEFDVVRASPLGRLIAWVCQAIGTPVVPRTGSNVRAIIHVGPVEKGASWLREYHWPRGDTHKVHSTKVISPAGTLTEELPARLRMPLDVYEHRGVLHFVSKGYYFDLGAGLKIPLPGWLSPGTTHVEHIDGTAGWFRFTMTVTHPIFGEVFYQTGRFRAAAGVRP